MNLYIGFGHGLVDFLSLGVCMCCVCDQGSTHSKIKWKSTLITSYLNFKILSMCCFIPCSSLSFLCVDTVDLVHCVVIIKIWELIHRCGSLVQHSPPFWWWQLCIKWLVLLPLHQCINTQITYIMIHQSNYVSISYFSPPLSLAKTIR
jgi:hypothetical protein